MADASSDDELASRLRADRARKRAALGKVSVTIHIQLEDAGWLRRMSRNLKNRLSLAVFKVEHHWETLRFGDIDAAFDPELGTFDGLAATTSTSTIPAATFPDLSSASAALASTAKSLAFRDKIASTSASPGISHVAERTEQSGAHMPSIPMLQHYPANASGVDTSMMIDPQMHVGGSNSREASSASAHFFSQSHTTQPQYAPSPHSFISPVPPTPTSAPPSQTSFLQNTVEQKKRARRDSAAPRSGSTKRASFAAPDADSGHKRKPSQNTLWQNSRAILGGGIGGPNLNLGGIAGENPMTSPVRMHQGTAGQVQDAYRSGGSATVSPASTTRAIVTPRHPQNHPPSQHPHTIAHTGQQHQYLPHQPSNLGPLPSSQHPLHAFISPTHTPYQQHPPTMNQQQYASLAMAHPQMNGTAPEFGAANALTSFNFPNPEFPGYDSMVSAHLQSHTFDASAGRSQSAVSRTPSDLSFGGHDPNSLSSSQDSSSLDTNLSQSNNISMNGTVMPNPVKSRPTTAGGPDAEGAAELMLFLAASPSPQQPSRKGSTHLNTLGGDSGNMKGRRLFTNEDESTGNQVRSIDATAPPSAGIGMNTDGKTAKLQHPQAQHDGTLQYDHQANGFSASQLQAAADLYGSEGNNPFAANYAQQLAQPFEYQNVLNGQGQQQYHYSPYSLVDAGAGVGLEADYTADW
ncbi:MAG: hypothetical protein CYPHOPRED_003658 [Cyphobasidiales sp. Tagirdzhanova-0007]|nr:MAG: hypothetical protein CYPHOPRED_003658 [Cyphobasidiales sp. Tagirdzhanova-0007]